MEKQKETCHMCDGKGYNTRPIVTGKNVVILKSTCFNCFGTGKVDK